MKKTLWILASLFCTHSLFAQVGIYSGSFDPPTNAHRKIILNAIHTLQLKQLIVYVNKYGRKTYKASAEDRKKMLEIMLLDQADMISVVIQNIPDKLADYLNIQSLHPKLILVTGEDSYYDRLTLPQNQRFPFDKIAIVPRDFKSSILDAVIEPNAMLLPVPNIHDISSTKVRQLLQLNNFSEIELHAEVLKYISENHLYSP